jgi:zeaxanthin glucosyltransferase
MKNYGILCPPAHGHINPFIILGKELKKRGNNVCFFNVIDIKEKILNTGMQFATFGENHYPKGSLNTLLNKNLSQCNELEMMQYWNQFCLEMVNNTTDELIEAIKIHKIDFLLVDQMDIIGGSIAEYLNIPFATIINSLPTNFEKNIPPPFTELSYDNSKYGKAVNKFAFSKVLRYYEKIILNLNTFRKKWDLEAFEPETNIFFNSQIGQISQIPKAFDFPRQELPDIFHYLGPFRDDEGYEKLEFPNHLLDGRPIIYSSLGTLCNGRLDIFHKIAEAAQNFDCQLVISIGSQELSLFANLPGNPIVLNFVPQNELLKKASLLISHCGANTILDAISNAVPIVAIPISLDQPSIAERIKFREIGEIVPFKDFSTEKLKEAIGIVLNNTKYKSNALAMQKEVAIINGTIEACNIITKLSATNSTFKNQIASTKCLQYA